MKRWLTVLLVFAVVGLLSAVMGFELFCLIG